MDKSDNQAKLTAEICGIFNLPFYQFSQLKQHLPLEIPQIKNAYSRAWHIWRDTVKEAAALAGAEFAPPHIERWSNGWTIRRHFFAYLKYEACRDSAAIFSLLLNRRRLTVSLDWHCWREKQSVYTPQDYRRWTQDFQAAAFGGFEIWRTDDDEYADHMPAARWVQENAAAAEDGIWCIGRHLDCEDLARHDAAAWIAQTVRILQPLYENIHRPAADPALR